LAQVARTGELIMNSLSILRDFFGESEIKATSKIVRKMPDYQLLELADRILGGSRNVPYFGLGRIDLETGAEKPYVSDVLTEDWNSGLIRIDSVPLKHLILYCRTIAAPDPIVGWAHQLVRQYEVDRETPDWGNRVLATSIGRIAPLEKLVDNGALQLFPPFYALGADTGRVQPWTRGGIGLAEGEGIDLNPSTVWANEASQLTEYCDPDDDPEEVFWNHYERRRSSNENHIWQSDAVAFELSQERIILDSTTLEGNSDLSDALTWQVTPFLRELIVEDCARAMGDELQIRGLDPSNTGDWSEIVDRGLEYSQSMVLYGGMERLRRLAGSGIDLGIEQLQAAVNFTSFVTNSRVLPVCANAECARLLTFASMELFSDAHAKSRPSTADSLSMPAAAFEIPSLAHVSLADIVTLRNSEEIFEEVRVALTTLQDECALLHSSDWGSYQREVDRHASEIVGPVHAKLKKSVQSSSILATAVGAATSGLVKLCVGGLASLFGSLGSPPGIAQSAGKIAKNTARKRFLHREREVACSILVQLVEEDH
jgi:hypothetical protein